MINNSFGHKIKTLRLKLGLTQAQLADRLNISASTIGMYEQGRREPDNNTLSKLCEELGTSGDYLLGINTEKNYGTEKEVDNVISEFINFLEHQENLMFNGQPIKKSERGKIISALRVATAVSISEFKSDNNVFNKSNY